MEVQARWAASVVGLVGAGLGLSIIDPFSAQSFRLQGGAVRPVGAAIDFSFASVLTLRREPKPAVTNFLETFDRAFAVFARVATQTSNPETAFNLASRDGR
jgi:hypothetical protein